MKAQALPYMPAMFATCMLFQTIYVLCVALWVVFPNLNGHAMLTVIFPGFGLLSVISFLYGLVASAVYGWSVAIIFVFFYNLWPGFARIVYGTKAA